jgi:hypothetical protein
MVRWRYSNHCHPSGVSNHALMLHLEISALNVLVSKCVFESSGLPTATALFCCFYTFEFVDPRPATHTCPKPVIIQQKEMQSL